MTHTTCSNLDVEGQAYQKNPQQLGKAILSAREDSGSAVLLCIPQVHDENPHE
jgi:hypothetical protein